MTVFLFADLAGFTALTEAHGDDEATKLVDEFRALVTRLLSSSMRLVKITGDAAMIVSDNADAAVSFARVLVNAAESLPGHPALRIGMHSGEAVERDGDYWGHAVNVAARVAAHARPCEIVVTEAVHKRLSASLQASFGDLGNAALRNVSGPVHLFSLSHTRDLVTDPVCRMGVSPAAAIASVRRENETYYFCSMKCANEFTRQPDVSAG